MREEEEESEAQRVLVQETPGELKANSSIITGVSCYHTNSSRAAGGNPANPQVFKSRILTHVNVKVSRTRQMTEEVKWKAAQISDCAPHERKKLYFCLWPPQAALCSKWM